mmetsp:Transcript_50488/g.116538  ORF Transcript_50488/g.116538 Transcript_50488/m.116538 type:complete len:276 (+) Transcript_50488:83-910(+)
MALLVARHPRLPCRPAHAVDRHAIRWQPPSGRRAAKALAQVGNLADVPPVCPVERCDIVENICEMPAEHKEEEPGQSNVEDDEKKGHRQPANLGEREQRLHWRQEQRHHMRRRHVAAARRGLQRGEVRRGEHTREGGHEPTVEQGQHEVLAVVQPDRDAEPAAVVVVAEDNLTAGLVRPRRDGRARLLPDDPLGPMHALLPISRHRPAPRRQCAAPRREQQRQDEVTDHVDASAPCSGSASSDGADVSHVIDENDGQQYRVACVAKEDEPVDLFA